MSTLALILVPAVVFAGAVWLVLAMREGRVAPTGRSRLSAPRPWVVVTVALLVLGVVVAPRLFGFTFLLLPFLWMRRGPRGRDPERRD